MCLDLLMAFVCLFILFCFVFQGNTGNYSNKRCLKWTSVNLWVFLMSPSNFKMFMQIHFHRHTDSQQQTCFEIRAFDVETKNNNKKRNPYFPASLGQSPSSSIISSVFHWMPSDGMDGGTWGTLFMEVKIFPDRDTFEPGPRMSQSGLTFGLTWTCELFISAGLLARCSLSVCGD